MEDKRITNSKSRIKDGLLNCLIESGLEGVSIKSVCEKVGINRCTFYAHFSSLADVYSQIEEELISGLDSSFIRYQKKEINYAELIHEYFQYFLEHKDILKILLKTDFASFVSLCMDYCRNVRKIDDADNCYVNQFSYAGAFMVAYQWLTNGEKESVEDLETILLGLLLRNNLDQLPVPEEE